MLRKFVVLAMFLAFTTLTTAQESTPVATVRTAAPDPDAVQFIQVAFGLTKPIYVTNAGDGSNRLFIVQQNGHVRILDGEELYQDSFLDVSSLISQSALSGGYSEQGLLGLAFHPNYAENGLFYIDYTDRNGDSVIAQYRVSATNPNAADPTSARIVLTQEQPYSNHNGGHIAFGPDGYLYIAFGDGGSQGDPEERAQNPAVWLGKILRIEVHENGTYTIPPDNPVQRNSSFAPEVWAYGLRNPWRFSFDSATGDLYIGDVGGSAWEEINFEPADSPGGVYYGWDAYEGNHALEADVPAEQVTFPVAEYSHAFGNTVVGGYVYRGAAMSELQGAYVYGDWGSGMMWTLYRDASGAWVSDTFMDTAYNISSFGTDEQNELYLVNYQGTIFRIAPA